MKTLGITFCLLVLISCQKKIHFIINNDNVETGSEVFIGQKKMNLYSGKLQIGDNLNHLFKKYFGQPYIKNVSVINIVPSIDTPVCESQTHSLGESKLLNPAIGRLTISRDLPMAQTRFAQAANLENITYLSDYKYGAFGKSTGLLMEGKELLARAIIVTDQAGIIKYIQVVSNIKELPNMDKAYTFANKLFLNK